MDAGKYCEYILDGRIETLEQQKLLGGEEKCIQGTLLGSYDSDKQEYFESLQVQLPSLPAVSTQTCCLNNDSFIPAIGANGSLPYRFSIAGNNFQSSDTFTAKP